jgi:hypothetical protein
LGVGQNSVSRVEQLNALLISTLELCVNGWEGKLSLVADFPDQEPVVLTGLAAFGLSLLS